MIFYDAHIHKKSLEAGGFIIGLEKKYDKETLSNKEAFLLHSVEEKYIFFLHLQSSCHIIYFPRMPYFPSGYSLHSRRYGGSSSSMVGKRPMDS